MSDLITIELCGQEMDDGRTYINSPDLKGFHYILEAGEGPETLEPIIMPFLAKYLSAEISKVRPAATPKSFLQRHVTRNRRASHSIPMVAELAACA